ncbi:MAG: hypothetical protein ACK55Z_18940 [bacterium]
MHLEAHRFCAFAPFSRFSGDKGIEVEREFLVNGYTRLAAKDCFEMIPCSPCLRLERYSALRGVCGGCGSGVTG